MKVRIFQGFNAALAAEPKATAEMFQARALQFSDRLKWPAVKVNALGWEVDEYDGEETWYVMAIRNDRRHMASGRLRFFSQELMVRDHFAGLDTAFIRNLAYDQWAMEATRFCASPGGEQAGGAVLFAGAYAGIEFDVDMTVAVYTRAAEMVYRRLGVSPILRGEDPSRDLKLGYWSFDVASLGNIRLGVGTRTSIVRDIRSDLSELRRPLPGVPQFGVRA